VRDAEARNPTAHLGRPLSRGVGGDLLGHSSIAPIGDVYGHTFDDTARTAIDGLATRLLR